MTGTGRTILLGTAIAGTLDLLSAFVFGGMAGASPTQILFAVASGPFPGMGSGVVTSLVGTLVHFTIMAAMVAAFVLVARQVPRLINHPVISGLLYGVALYLIMYWLVLPLRFPATHPKSDWWTITNALFSHCVRVGLPIAFTARAARAT